MATAGSVVIDLIMRTGGFETDSKRAEQRMRGLEKEAKRIGTAIGAALAAGATAVTVALKQSIDRMDELSKAAQRAQMPTEQFSQLAYAGSLADVAMEDLTKSMGKLAKAQGDAARGLTEQVDGFEALGIAFKNADGSLRPTFDVFLDFADAFEKHKGSPEIMALGMQVFGRSFQNLIPLLKEGRSGIEEMADEADRLGYTISTEAGEAAEEFNDNLTRLKTAALGLANSVAADLLPDLVKLSENLLTAADRFDGGKTGAEKLADGIRTVATIAASSINLISGLAGVVGGFTQQTVAFGQALVAVARLDAEMGARADANYRAGANDLDAAMKRIVDPKRFGVFATPTPGSYDGPLLAPSKFAPPKPPEGGGDDPIIITPTGGGSKGGGKSEAERAAEALDRAYTSLNERLAEQIALHGTTGEAARVRYEIEHGALSALDEAKAAQLIKDAEHLDLLDEIAEHEQMVADIARETAEDEARRLQQYQDVRTAIEDQIALTHMSADAQEIWNNLKWAGVSAESEWGKAITESTQELQRQRDLMDDQITAMDGLRDSARGFARDIRDGVGAWESLKNAADSFVDVLWEIALNNLVEGLFGKQGDAGGGAWGDAIGQALGAFFGGGRASGGDVMPRTAYLVGEQGPEMFVPRTAGTIVPAGETARRMGGGTNFTQVNHHHYAAPERQATQDQVNARTATAAQRVLMRNSA